MVIQSGWVAPLQGILHDTDPLAVAAITSIVEEQQHHHNHSATVIWMGMRS